MNVEFITIEDFKKLKVEIISEVKECLQSKQSESIWLKSSEVKKILGCSEGTLVNLRTKGLLPYSKINGTIYIRKEDLNRLFNSNIVA